MDAEEMGDYVITVRRHGGGLCVSTGRMKLPLTETERSAERAGLSGAARWEWGWVKWVEGVQRYKLAVIKSAKSWGCKGQHGD